jgi:hypothetical protein
MKTVYLLIACIFIGASIYTMIKCKECPPFIEYKATLNDKQKRAYNDIVAERQNIYLKGLVVGSIVGLVYLWHNHGSINIYTHSIVFTAITLGIQYLFYMLYPKSKWMLNVLETREQIDGWLEVYKFMKGRYHIGMLLGLMGYLTLSYGTMAN